MANPGKSGCAKPRVRNSDSRAAEENTALARPLSSTSRKEGLFHARVPAVAQDRFSPLKKFCKSWNFLCKILV
jgi:hypothetical protein